MVSRIFSEQLILNDIEFYIVLWSLYFLCHMNMTRDISLLYTYSTVIGTVRDNKLFLSASFNKKILLQHISGKIFYSEYSHNWLT